MASLNGLRVSQTDRTDPSSLGWPIHVKPVVQLPKTPELISATLKRAGRQELFFRTCRESFQSTSAFCLWIIHEDLCDEYPPEGWGPPPESPTPPPFSIETISGSGRGMVASRFIKSGETIVVERPIVIYPIIYGTYDERGVYGVVEDLLEAGFPALGETERLLYLDLWNCKTLTGTLGNQIRGISRMNGLCTRFTRSKHLPFYAGVFPSISRCNHSCGPNASATFDEETMATRLFARRPIAPGEQITISYIDTEIPYAFHQEELKTKYLFTCPCNYCKPTKPTKPSRPFKHPYWNIANQTTNKYVDLPAEIYASDIRREQIAFRMDHAKKLWVEWLSPSSKQSDKDLVQFHEDAMVILAQEGLESKRISHIAYLAHVCAALKDEGGFRRWGSILISLTGWPEGRDRLEVMKTWKDWLCDPTISPAWGLRLMARGKAQNTPPA
ncbi:SET domain-containing protein [Rickenella mellea]|uniref:SET domain-containing protein n=1 Tax=Rickenella mellea TaxID=50990 RepID=A0A4Y7Q977_9AGAM|nr:SET domain-containing protein [Rickenella mellea]